MLRCALPLLLVACSAATTSVDGSAFLVDVMPVDCEDASSEWFLDADGDGFGAGLAVVGCRPSLAWVPDAGDCNDAYAAVNPETWWYLDADGDGWGGSQTSQGCFNPGGHVLDSGDCDDQEPTVHPGGELPCTTASEPACGNGVSVRGGRYVWQAVDGEEHPLGEEVLAYLR